MHRYTKSMNCNFETMFRNISVTTYHCVKFTVAVPLLNFSTFTRTKRISANKYNREISLCASLFAENDDKHKALILKSYFDTNKEKSKDTYLEAIRMYANSEVSRRGQVEFILSALSLMEEYGVHEDLEVYKALIDILPKGKFIPENVIQSEFMHYPKQQNCVLHVLEQMEDNAVIPDKETQELLLNIFGKHGIPLQKLWRMLYWMPKFKHLSPWPLPKPVPNDSYELSQIAIDRMSTVDLQSKVVTYKTSDIEDSIEDTWIVSSQSPTQRDLLNKHPKEKAVYIEGPFRIWLREKSVNYFVLRGEPPPPFTKPTPDIDDVSRLPVPLVDEPVAKVLEYRTVHEQDDATIYALCATGTSSRDSLLSWIRHLEKDGNPALSNLVVLFPQASPLGDIIQLGSPEDERKKESEKEIESPKAKIEPPKS